MRKPPKTMTPQEMSIKTDPFVMSSINRDMVFNAYEFNYKKQIYELTRPELITDEIIGKLLEWQI